MTHQVHAFRSVLGELDEGTNVLMLTYTTSLFLKNSVLAEIVLSVILTLFPLSSFMTAGSGWTTDDEAGELVHA